MKRLLNTDTLLGAALALIGTALLVSSYRQSASVFVLPGDAPPLLVPQLFLYLLIALSAILLLFGVLRGGADFATPSWGRIAAAFAIVASATALMTTLGFLAVAPVAVFLTCLTLGYRNHLLNLAVAAGVVGLLYALLTGFANMPLPKVPGLGY